MDMCIELLLMLRTFCISINNGNCFVLGPEYKQVRNVEMIDCESRKCEKIFEVGPTFFLNLLNPHGSATVIEAQ